jgi:hypothetical protein
MQFNITGDQVGVRNADGAGSRVHKFQIKSGDFVVGSKSAEDR